ncbi:hypothetical protein KGA66_26515 [Actinocrinis puniceicyclus]|uniref:Uncharacterized protein n=1 Tax=Actinocrinis puniceicyclus TaxID=977794 RepID=A0A8J7WS93_9ACTN|nr:hypothetical protein [Actinocrinis puniceicyclus]MBS2966618.1 hypothetical protein [Actinocrinis puniceicyclus]
MHLSIPITLLLGLAVLFMIRKDGLKSSHALVAVLFGFLLSTTVLAARIGQVDSMIAGLLGGSISQR